MITPELPGMGNGQQEHGTGTEGDGAHGQWQAVPQSQTGGPSVSICEMGKGLAPHTQRHVASGLGVRLVP